MLENSESQIILSNELELAPEKGVNRNYYQSVQELYDDNP